MDEKLSPAGEVNDELLNVDMLNELNDGELNDGEDGTYVVVVGNDVFGCMC